jgi:16S rRNA (adenine1518-N6/adenine1519-N6)-dimethyltransferase
MSDTLIQIVDKQDRPVGEASIDEAQKQGLIHRIARVMIEDGNGGVLLQRRALHKGLFPGRWDNSVAGHVDAGESYEIAAHRETEEEIGLNGLKLEEIGKYYNEETFEWRSMKRFNTVFRAIVPRNAVFGIDREEVDSVEWFHLPDIAEMVKNDPGQLTDGVIDVINRYYL